MEDREPTWSAGVEANRAAAALADVRMCACSALRPGARARPTDQDIKSSSQRAPSSSKHDVTGRAESVDLARLRGK
jgi:hypothetical protein